MPRSRSPRVSLPLLHMHARTPLMLFAPRLRSVDAQRFALLQQRISRNKLFTRPALSSAGASDGARYCELTPLQALLGTAGETHYVMGALSQLEDGRFYLEDLTASIQVDLSTAATTAGLFTENCIVVAEGAVDHHGVFEVLFCLPACPIAFAAWPAACCELCCPWAFLQLALYHASVSVSVLRSGVRSGLPSRREARGDALCDCRVGFFRRGDAPGR